MVRVGLIPNNGKQWIIPNNGVIIMNMLIVIYFNNRKLNKLSQLFITYSSNIGGNYLLHIFGIYVVIVLELLTKILVIISYI